MRTAAAIGVAGLLLVAGRRPPEDRVSPADVAAIRDKQQKGMAAMDELNELQRGVESLTFTATYAARAPDWTTDQIVMAQKPPQSMYQKGSTRLLDDGQHTFTCNEHGCRQTGRHVDSKVTLPALESTEAPPIVASAFGRGFSPTTFRLVYLQAAMGMRTHLTSRTREIAGKTSECYTVVSTLEGQKDIVGCMSRQGIFTFSDDREGTVVELTKLEHDAADSLFVAS